MWFGFVLLLLGFGKYGWDRIGIVGCIYIVVDIMDDILDEGCILDGSCVFILGGDYFGF